MTDFMAVITDFLAGLQPRERLFIKVGAVALAIALLIMMLLPKWESYSQIKGQRDTLAADFIWLQEKREMVAGLANNCPSVRQKKENFKDDVIKFEKLNVNLSDLNTRTIKRGKPCLEYFYRKFIIWLLRLKTPGSDH